MRQHISGLPEQLVASPEGLCFFMMVI